VTRPQGRIVALHHRRGIRPRIRTTLRNLVLNHAYQWIPRWNRCLRSIPTITSPRRLCGRVFSTKARSTCSAAGAPGGSEPVYMQQHYDDIPASVRFPREEINAWFKSRASVSRASTPTTTTRAASVRCSPSPSMRASARSTCTESIYFRTTNTSTSARAVSTSSASPVAAAQGVHPEAVRAVQANYVYGYSFRRPIS